MNQSRQANAKELADLSALFLFDYNTIMRLIHRNNSFLHLPKLAVTELVEVKAVCLPKAPLPPTQASLRQAQASSRKITITFITILLTLLLTNCSEPIENYKEENAPYFAKNYAPKIHPFAGNLKIITWNIRYSIEIEQTIKELQEVEALQNTDILLLQEMDETGVDKIAHALAYNYIYFPASIHSKNDSNFGNAILSKWELSNPEKLILPHENPKNEQIRIAAKAITTIDDLDILLVSIHTETAWLSSAKRNEQVDAIVVDIGDAETVFVGGDFNSITAVNVSTLDEKFAKIDMIRVSKDAEPTVKVAGAGFSADHIFARNIVLIENGVYSETKASDHYPVWVDVWLEDEQ